MVVTLAVRLAEVTVLSFLCHLYDESMMSSTDWGHMLTLEPWLMGCDSLGRCTLDALHLPPSHTCTAPLMRINSKFCHLHQFPQCGSKHMADRAGTKGSRAYYHIKLAHSSLLGVNPVTYGFINGLHYHDQTLLQHLPLTPSTLGGGRISWKSDNRPSVDFSSSLTFWPLEHEIQFPHIVQLSL